ncbi:MAG: thymidine phosphorylase [Aestuariivita sp.]|nr:thymidine phosphorylase [Aestuariivita sp.]
MDARSIISRLKRGEEVTKEELHWFATGLSDGSVSDAQAGAFAMCICLRGLSSSNRIALTLAMRNSGQLLSWKGIEGPVIDKHSTGGVGDCVSLVLIPALAACGGYIPKISGRGLGHTGGTLDKLEAIPGVKTQVSSDQLKCILKEAGCAIVGATSRIAPADKRLYAVRDVTATVDSVDLIAASILSKKLAVNPDALVLDVKVGRGALVKTISEAQMLATVLTDIANSNEFKCKTTALITDMNQPLAPVLGNALELREVMRVLTGDTNSGALLEVVSALGGELLSNTNLAEDRHQGVDKVKQTIRDGRAAEHFNKMIYAMGGPATFCHDWDQVLPCAKVIHEVVASSEGYICSVNGERLGLAVIDLGGGRKVETDSINASVGISAILRIGTKVDKGQPIALIHAQKKEDAFNAERVILDAIKLSSTPPIIPVLIHDRVH